MYSLFAWVNRTSCGVIDAIAQDCFRWIDEVTPRAVHQSDYIYSRFYSESGSAGHRERSNQQQPTEALERL